MNNALLIVKLLGLCSILQGDVKGRGEKNTTSFS